MPVRRRSETVDRPGSRRAPRARRVVYAVGVLLLTGSPFALAQTDLYDTVDTAAEQILVAAPDSAAPGGDSASAHVVRYDSTALDPRLPSDRVLAQYRALKDFDYGREFRQPETLWERIVRWIGRSWQELFGDDGDQTFWDILAWVILIGSFIFVVLKLVGVEVGGIFARKGRAGTATAVAEGEDFATMDFASAIARAENAGALREATRLHYLWVLRTLSDAGTIAWRPDKTDLDYARELSSSHLREPFERAALLFDYVWYGDVPLDQRSYTWVRDAIASVRGRS